MTLEPPPTLSTLEPDPGRRLRALKWAALCGAAAWLWGRPTQVPSVLVAVLVGGPAFWFGLGPGWGRFKYHPKLAVRIVARCASIALVVFTMKKIVPLLEAHVGTVL